MTAISSSASAHRKVHFFVKDASFVAVGYDGALSAEYISRLEYMTGGNYVDADEIESFGHFVGPKTESISPFSTNAVEGARNIGIEGVTRIEEYGRNDPSPNIDRMLQRLYSKLNQEQFTVSGAPQPVYEIVDLAEYNKDEGLALSPEEIAYLEDLSEKLGRSLTDSEVFGFSQANSEHCRHKIFNGTFVIDGKEQPETLFRMIRETTEKNPGIVVSAYTDNVAFIQGPTIVQWAPGPDGKFRLTPIQSVVSGKVETHNFPTTVAAGPGAGTGAGGRIRDGMGGGVGSVPLAGSAAYMIPYPRVGINLMPWETEPRKWLYQTPQQMGTRASDGASDYGNKFGEPLIHGGLLTFEHEEGGVKYGYEKTIMLSGGIGYANKEHAHKDEDKIEKGQRIILLGGDNYRIGMGGGSVASLDVGDAMSSVELNAVQRANPEMQKRVFNVIRALSEMINTPVVSIHDHGAGGHFNSFLELVAGLGGHIDMSKLPVGDKTLSDKEIIGNESQERMVLLADERDVPLIMKIAAREQCRAYDVGHITGDMRFVFERPDGVRPIDMEVKDLLGNPPKTVISDNRVKRKFAPVKYDDEKFADYVQNVLRLHGVGSKDWLTNKVDRSVTGKVAQQQCVGPLQLPLSDYGMMKMDYDTDAAIASSMGFAPAAGLIDAGAGSRLSIARALTNMACAPLAGGLPLVSLSANWMWPCKNPGEDARLYDAVRAAGEFAKALGVNIPTGKDSLSMTQKYPDGEKVMAPGTVVISAFANAHRLDKKVLPVMATGAPSDFYLLDFSGCPRQLGGSAFAQTLARVGGKAPDVKDAKAFARMFAAVQEMVDKGIILAGHDISGGGLVTTLLEMAFANTDGGISVNLNGFSEESISRIMFAENPGLVVQVEHDKAAKFRSIIGSHRVKAQTLRIGNSTDGRSLDIAKGAKTISMDIDYMRDVWVEPSNEMELHQNKLAGSRFLNYNSQPLKIDYRGTRAIYANRELKATAAVLRDKGTNGEREMTYAAHLGGFEVKDIAMTDLMAGRENLKDVDLLIFPGGFSNSDVFGAGKVWASVLKYNPRVDRALRNFYARRDTLSLGVCNGCQVMMELGLIGGRAPMRRNASGKFESAFLSTCVPENTSVMMSYLSGATLPVWVANGEGRFDLGNLEPESYQVVLKYNYELYPGNPNGSPGGVAGIASADGRHLAMMPHPERSVLPHQWAYDMPGNPAECKLFAEGNNVRKVTPWVRMFTDAREWVLRNSSRKR